MPIRIDQIEKYYKPIERCETWSDRLFWTCAVFSLAIPYLEIVPIIWLRQVFIVFFIVAVVAHAMISHYNGFYLIPVAERARRKQLISNALNVPLTHEVTEGYYNNEITPSISRLGACVLENAFFAKNVCQEMARKERLKVFLYFLFWIAAISFRNTDLGIVLTLTQVLFSSNIVFRYIKLEMLRMSNNTIYNDLYSHFLSKPQPTYLPGIAGILNSFASYESAKASASIKQSTKIFDELNPQLSDEWKEIHRRLGLDSGEFNRIVQATSGDAPSTT